MKLDNVKFKAKVVPGDTLIFDLSLITPIRRGIVLVEEAQTYIEGCMRYVPTWAEGLPLDCESGVAKSYGDCE